MAFQDSSTPVTPGPLLPIHSPPQQRLLTHEKPLPSPPHAEERHGNGIKQWWKRNRYRSKQQGASPGQAELGIGESSREVEKEGSRRKSGRAGYDMDVLTRQLAAVDFSSDTGTVEQKVVSHRIADGHNSSFVVPPFPPRPTTTISLPHAHSAQPLDTYSESSDKYPLSQHTSTRPPARYALHVRAEDEGIHHSASAPQLETYSHSYPTSHSHSQTHSQTASSITPTCHRLPANGLPYRSFASPVNPYSPSGNVYRGNGGTVKTFEPDSRALERFPDSPTARIEDHRSSRLTRGQEQSYQTLQAPSGPRTAEQYSDRDQQGYPLQNDDTYILNYPQSASSSGAVNNTTQAPYPAGTFKVPTTPTHSRRSLAHHAPAPTASTSARGQWTAGSSTTSTPLGAKSPVGSSAGGAGAGAGGGTIQCSGYTQKGQRCKKKVKAVAAYYSIRPPAAAAPPSNFVNIYSDNHTYSGGSSSRNESARDDHDHGRQLSMFDSFGSQVTLSGTEKDGAEEEKRFCNVHVGQICSPEGFYVRHEGVSVGSDVGRRGRWVEFDDYIPHDLEEQTKVLLRRTMESPLTSNESAGFIYAYELRDIGSDSVAYYKVGRTDNVPRRLNEWKLQCTSHRPTLRDIFPQRDCTSTNGESRPSSSVLPGAMSNQEDQCMAVKRLEKLIHIELSARQVTLERLLANQAPFSTLLRTGRPCPDCQTTHREIFAIPRDYQYSQPHRQMREQDDQIREAMESVEYERVVRSVILRWQKFVDALTTRV